MREIMPLVVKDISMKELDFMHYNQEANIKDKGG